MAIEHTQSTVTTRAFRGTFGAISLEYKDGKLDSVELVKSGGPIRGPVIAIKFVSDFASLRDAVAEVLYVLRQEPLDEGSPVRGSKA